MGYHPAGLYHDRLRQTPTDARLRAAAVAVAALGKAKKASQWRGTDEEDSGGSDHGHHSSMSDAGAVFLLSVFVCEWSICTTIIRSACDPLPILNIVEYRSADVDKWGVYILNLGDFLGLRL